MVIAAGSFLKELVGIHLDASGRYRGRLGDQRQSEFYDSAAQHILLHFPPGKKPGAVIGMDFVHSPGSDPLLPEVAGLFTRYRDQPFNGKNFLGIFQRVTEVKKFMDTLQGGNG